MPKKNPEFVFSELVERNGQIVLAQASVGKAVQSVVTGLHRSTRSGPHGRPLSEITSIARIAEKIAFGEGYNPPNTYHVRNADGSELMMIDPFGRPVLSGCEVREWTGADTARIYGGNPVLALEQCLIAEWLSNTPPDKPLPDESEQTSKHFPASLRPVRLKHVLSCFALSRVELALGKDSGREGLELMAQAAQALYWISSSHAEEQMRTLLAKQRKETARSGGRAKAAKMRPVIDRVLLLWSQHSGSLNSFSEDAARQAEIREFASRQGVRLMPQNIGRAIRDWVREAKKGTAA